MVEQIGPQFDPGKKINFDISKLVPGGKAPDGKSFKQVLMDSINKVNEMLVTSDKDMQNVIAGKETKKTLAEIMVEVQKADLAFKNLMQIRNKLVDAYEEIMRLRL